MGYVEKRNVNENDIKIGETYYTCSYTGAIKVTLLKILKDDNVLVMVKRKDGKNDVFTRPKKYLFSTYTSAKQCGKRWEHAERQRKKKQKEERKHK